MSVEIVYFNTQPNEWLENKMTRFGRVHAARGDERREFLVALSSAVADSNITVTAGEIEPLCGVLSKGLGLPLEPVDWDSIGIRGDQSAVLPHGSLPLISDGRVGGMIIENGSQCIIAVDSEQNTLARLVDDYVVPYIRAIESDSAAAPAEPDAAQQEPSPLDPPAEPDAAQAELPVQPDGEEAAAKDEDGFDEVDLFADLDSDGFLDIEPKKKRHGVLVGFIIVLAVLVLAAAGIWFGYTKWWLPKQYDDVLKQAQKAYSSSLNSSAADSMPAEYSVKFASLYSVNEDVIGWLKVSGLGIDTPIVTQSLHSEGYYDTHLFNGSNNPYGTAYIKYGYDTSANVNPNLVVYAGNSGDSRGFSRIESLLSAEGLKKVKSITTDSVLYGQQQWQMISVMLIKADGSEYDYTDNFRDLDLSERAAAVKAAVERTKVATGFSTDDFETVEYTDSFITLVTKYSKDPSKVVAVMAFCPGERSDGEEGADSESSSEEETVGGDNEASSVEDSSDAETSSSAESAQ